MSGFAVCERGALRTFARPEAVGEETPGVAQIGPTGHALQLPVQAHESAEVGLVPGREAFVQHADVPRARIDAQLARERQRAVAELIGRCLDAFHARPIGTGSTPFERVHPDGVATRRAHFVVVRPPTVIEPGRLVAGRHPSANGFQDAGAIIRALRRDGVTLFLDLTQDGELEPYTALVVSPARYVNRPIRDFSVPEREALVATLDEIDAELAAGGVVYVHCWAGCGRTGVVVGSWLVRHGADPAEALRRVAELRGAGCPQTLEQRLWVLNWQPGL